MEPGHRHLAWELNGDVASCIVAYLLEERSPYYDEDDMAKDAASFMLVGNSSFTLLGEQMYAQLSPRLGQEPPGGVSHGSPAPKLKEALKAWGLPLSGTKAALWERLEDEVTPVHETLCPISRAMKARILSMRTVRVSATKAKELFHVDKTCLEGLPTRMEVSNRFGAYLTYDVRDVKKIARRMRPGWGAYRKMVSSEKAHKERWTNAGADRDARRMKVVAALQARGVDEVQARRGATCLWHLEYMEFMPRKTLTDEDLLACTNTVHEWIFCKNHTDLTQRTNHVKSTHVYRKGKSQYKQEYDLERVCQKQALEVWLSDQPTLQAALAATPDCMHGSVKAQWGIARKNKAEGKGPKRINELAQLT